MACLLKIFESKKVQALNRREKEELRTVILRERRPAFLENGFDPDKIKEVLGMPLESIGCKHNDVSDLQDCILCWNSQIASGLNINVWFYLRAEGIHVYVHSVGIVNPSFELWHTKLEKVRYLDRGQSRFSLDSSVELILSRGILVTLSKNFVGVEFPGLHKVQFMGLQPRNN